MDMTTDKGQVPERTRHETTRHDRYSTMDLELLIKYNIKNIKISSTFTFQRVDLVESCSTFYMLEMLDYGG